MLFNSYEFILFFLPISFLVYFFLLDRRLIIGAKGFLVFASLFFYSWWNITYLPIILSSMLFNYLIGNTLNENFSKIKVGKKSVLFFGISTNLALLGYFKYSDFLIENFNLLLSTNIELLNLLLPLAISFFTFQQIAYLVDSYKNETKEYDFLNYALFVTFFPQLIAGPIVHHKEMMPQFSSRFNLRKKYSNIAMGLFIFSIGLFKKAVIADTFAIIASTGFNNAESLTLFEAWFTSLSYTFQLYFDFSGYTDMAIGAALLFNIRLPINFNSPYKALNIQDFWRRWHITLSRFLKEYIYIPLGGNRRGGTRTYINLLATFLLGGIWHGAGWTFLFWGLLHGLALGFYRFWTQFNITLPKSIAWFISFNFINITWIFFRAENFEQAFSVLNAMFFGTISLSYKYADKLSFLNEYGVLFGPWLNHLGGDKLILLYILLATILVLTFKNSSSYLDEFKPSKKFLWLSSIMLILTVLSSNRVSEFLYFNF